MRTGETKECQSGELTFDKNSLRYRPPISRDEEIYNTLTNGQLVDLSACQTAINFLTMFSRHAHIIK